VKERLNFVPPPFDYTGDLRPAWVSPRRPVPAHIQKPDYAVNGQPQGENRHSIHLNSPAEIKGIRAACRIGRQALDVAHAMIKPGVTTDDIDVAVHDFIISQDAYPSPLNYRFFPKSVCTSVDAHAHSSRTANAPRAWTFCFLFPLFSFLDS
jgi:methionyl aminopeptidase